MYEPVHMVRLVLAVTKQRLFFTMIQFYSISITKSTKEYILNLNCGFHTFSTLTLLPAFPVFPGGPFSPSPPCEGKTQTASVTKIISIFMKNSNWKRKCLAGALIVLCC